MSSGEQSESGTELKPHVHAWMPLRNPLFRAISIAAFVGHLGGWMRDIGTAWLMTSLVPSPFMVGLIQVAANIPNFLLSLIAGVFSDVLDRRKLLIATHLWLVLLAGLLAYMDWRGLVGPWALLSFTFLISVGNALTWPAWQAITPELVNEKEVSAAIAMGGISYNLARVFGPALGGFIIARYSTSTVFALSSVSYLALLGVLCAWKRPRPSGTLARESISGAVKSGWRYLRHAPYLQIILVRACTFIFFAGSLWALLPLLARKDYGLNSTGYGVLMGWFGAGAVAGGFALPWVRRKITSEQMITYTSFAVALHLIALAQLRNQHLVHIAMLVGGAIWSMGLLSYNISVLNLSPHWVRSRALALYLFVFTGAQVVCSAVWGGIAEEIGIARTLLVAGVCLVLVLAFVTRRFPMPDDNVTGLAPSTHDRDYLHSMKVDPQCGPIRITISYRISRNHVGAFENLLRELKMIRMRNGAIAWNSTHDAIGCYTEEFLMETWIDYLRHHDRMTVAERGVEERVAALHEDTRSIRVEHQLADSGESLGGEMRLPL